MDNEESSNTNVTDIETCAFCNDPFRMGECPEHPSEKTDEYMPLETQEVVVTPGHRFEPTRRVGITGFAFLCDVCGKNSIMHWFKFCPECGSKINFTFEIPEGI